MIPGRGDRFPELSARDLFFFENLQPLSRRFSGNLWQGSGNLDGVMGAVAPISPHVMLPAVPDGAPPRRA
jgi:hypothetical protein